MATVHQPLVESAKLYHCFPQKNLGLDNPKKTGLEELEELISHCSLDYVTHQGFMVHRTG
jgi:hypothetical protein